jgi:serine/threonine protein kinase
MPSDSARVEATTRVWAVVGARLEEFARAWEAGDPPDPARFLPDGPPAVRRLTLVELVKLDIDYRLARGLARAVEDYVAAFPELAADGPPCDLLYEDYQLRQRAGLAARPEDYFRRFPGRAAELARLLGGTDPARSTSVFAARAPLAVGPGEQLDEFDLLTQLGEGQFAKVFLARQRGMQRLVALKVSARKAAEAQTLARLDHPHVVRVYDQRFLADRGVQLVYMSYLPGGTLLDVLHHARTVPPERRSGRTLLEAVDAALDRRGEVPPATSPARQHWAGLSWPATVCELGAKLAAALDYAHRRGVLHRDVKPANVLLTGEGEPQLADFNVGYCSKVEGAGPADFFGGTLGYMAPEHLEAFNPGHPRPPESLDGRADLYGLAVTLWEMLAGSRPFGHDELLDSWEETLAAIAERRRAGPPPAVVAALPEGDVPGLREVLLRCLDPDPDRRPATAGEMARELELCLRPATRDLVRPRPGGWREAVRRHPLLTAYPAGLAPNLLASLFNIAYNRKEIIDPWPAAHAAFDTVMLAVNGFFFPLGMLLFALAIWPVMRGLRRTGRLTPDEATRLRLRTLRLGGTAAGICVGCWLVAGVIWPAVLRAVAGPPPQGPAAYLHFVASLAVCGLIAAAYPYFVVTFLAVRVLYPALLGPAGPGPADGPALARVGRELGWYRVVAAGVPLAAVAALAWRGATNPFAVAVLSVTGLAGTLLAYVLEGRTRADLAALADAPRDQGG